MKHTFAFLLPIILVLSACAPAPAPTATPTAVASPTASLTPTATPTPTPTSTPTPIPMLEVKNLRLPDPRYTNPELFDLTNSAAPITQFVNAMRMAGMEITGEEVAQNLRYQGLTGKDGNPFVVAVYNLDPDPSKTGETLEGPIPLLIATQDEKGEWRWEEVTPGNLAKENNRNISISISIADTTTNTYYNQALSTVNAVTLADALWKIPYSSSASLAVNPTTVNTRQLETAIKYAQRYGNHITAFHLLWGTNYTLPDWVLNGNYTQDELLKLQTDYIQKIVGVGKGKINTWVVVNEPFGSGEGQKFWLDRFNGSTEWIKNAFRVAGKVDPEALLLLNDFGIEIPGSWLYQQTPTKNQKVQEILVELKNEGLNVGVGFQMHLIGSELTNTNQRSQFVEAFKQNVLSYKEKDIKVVITEMDVNMHDVNPVTKEQILAQIYHDFVKAALEAGVDEITFFGYKDDQSWLVTSQNVKDASPTLFDNAMQPKLAYYSVIKAIAAEMFSK